MQSVEPCGRAGISRKRRAKMSDRLSMQDPRQQYPHLAVRRELVRLVDVAAHRERSKLRGRRNLREFGDNQLQLRQMPRAVPAVLAVAILWDRYRRVPVHP